MTATLINDNGLTRVYQISTGEMIELILDEDELTVSAKNSQNQEIGSVEFLEIDNDYDLYYKLRWMYLDKLGNKYKKQGIGRACVELFNDYFDVIVTAEENDGIPKDDGSHLTQDAPGFVQKLREEGLIL